MSNKYGSAYMNDSSAFGWKEELNEELGRHLPCFEELDDKKVVPEKVSAYYLNDGSHTFYDSQKKKVEWGLELNECFNETLENEKENEAHALSLLRRGLL